MRPLLRTLSLPLSLTLRSQQIGYAFYRYGVGGTLAAFGIEASKRGLKMAKLSQAPHQPLDAVFGKNLARTFSHLGPTFIKLGQVLATRPDLIGEPIAEELRVLFDRVPPVPFRQIKKILRSELGKKKASSAFKSIDSKPLASASLSQTHHAVLKNGTPVILKVQKDGVASKVEMDLVLLEGFVRSASLVYPKYQLMQVFEEFKQGTLREIDYREEAKNIAHFQKNYHALFAKGDVVFPKFYPELSTRRVLVLEPLHGKKVSDLTKGSRVAKRAATLSLSAVLEQIFDHGFFHADPHGGNLFFLEDTGRIGFIDLGLVGQLNSTDKRKFLKVILAILKRDRERLARALYEMGEPSKKTDYAAFERAIQDMLDAVKKKGIDSVRMDKLVNDLLAVARANGILIPNRYILMIRSCLVIEGVAKSLDPSLSVFDIAVPIVAKSLLKTYSPFQLLRRRK